MHLLDVRFWKNLHMIVDQNTHPERDLYYLGSVMIKTLSNSKESTFDYLNLYSLFSQEREISIKLFSLTLDWLFLLGLIRKDKQGGIIKCF